MIAKMVDTPHDTLEAITVPDYSKTNTQTWDTEAKAREVIELHKKQNEPKITYTYIEV